MSFSALVKNLAFILLNKIQYPSSPEALQNDTSRVFSVNNHSPKTTLTFDPAHAKRYDRVV